MPKTFAEMAAERDPLYQATKPVGDMASAIGAQNAALLLVEKDEKVAFAFLAIRDSFLLRLAVRALRGER